MAEYIKIKTVTETEVDQYLADGWEIMGETISYYTTENTPLKNFDIGLPAKAMVEHLSSIIKDYERFGFKGKLFAEIAKEYGERNDLLHEENEFTKYVHNYELYVSEK